VTLKNSKRKSKSKSATKILAGNADSADILNAIILMRVVPVMKDISKRLEWICTAIAPDKLGVSVGSYLEGIEKSLDRFLKIVASEWRKK
jgi:hypothetical protein